MSQEWTFKNAETGHLSCREATEPHIAFTTGGNVEEVVRVNKHGVTVNPAYPLDDAAKHVINALDAYIKRMVASQRPWVGLTNEEIQTIWRSSEHMNEVEVCRAIEAKLRENMNTAEGIK